MDNKEYLRQIIYQVCKTEFDNGQYSNAANFYIKPLIKIHCVIQLQLMPPSFLYNLKDYKNAIKYFSLATQSKKQDVIEKAMRYKAISLFNFGDKKAACAEFIKLININPKECTNKNLPNIVGKNKL